MTTPIQNWADLTFDQQQQVLSRPAQADNEKLSKIVSDILLQVKHRGDDAIRELTKKFDGIRLAKLRLNDEQIINAKNEISENVKSAIDLAYSNIKTFHQAQLPKDVRIETQPGVICELKHAAIDSVGLYIPGGSAPLPSTVLMLGATAQVAGCQRKVLCTPPDAKAI